MTRAGTPLKGDGWTPVCPHATQVSFKHEGGVTRNQKNAVMDTKRQKYLLHRNIDRLNQWPSWSNARVMLDTGCKVLINN